MSQLLKFVVITFGFICGNLFGAVFIAHKTLTDAVFLNEVSKGCLAAMLFLIIRTIYIKVFTEGIRRNK